VTTTTVQCVACEHSKRPLRLERGDSEMLRSGFRLCGRKSEPFKWFSAIYPRECALFEAATPEVERARREWLAGTLA